MCQVWRIFQGGFNEDKDLGPYMGMGTSRSCRKLLGGAAKKSGGGRRAGEGVE